MIERGKKVIERELNRASFSQAIHQIEDFFTGKIKFHINSKNETKIWLLIFILKLFY